MESAAPAAISPFTIDADFPGGNIVVDRLLPDGAELHPDLRDTEGGWFYWCFRARGAAGRTLTFRFTAQDPIGVRGPAVSLDAGITWNWLGANGATTSTFTYTFPPDANEVRFGMGMTYTQEHLDRFLQQLGPATRLVRGTLCQSRKGRAVEQLALGNPKALRCLLITARHHCCEMMASYSLEGLIQASLADDPLGRWMGGNVDIRLIPFVDKDGVEDGDQGKNRRPRDHNRDYLPPSVYPETQAIRDEVPQWLRGRPLVMLDLHCPWIRGHYNEFIYQVGLSSPRIWAQQQCFGRILEQVRHGPLSYHQANDLPFGQEWNTPTNGSSSSYWASSLPDVGLATSIELPYANAAGQEVNATTARAWGTDVAAALKAFIDQDF
jgi:hypothetical protein